MPHLVGFSTSSTEKCRGSLILLSRSTMSSGLKQFWFLMGFGVEKPGTGEKGRVLLVGEKARSSSSLSISWL